MWPVLGEGVCSDLNWRAQQHQMAVRKSFEMMSGVILNWLQPKCDVWKPCSDQRWQDKLQFSIWRFFELSDLVNNHLLCYWPTIHNSISKICPKFQVPSSHFFEVDELRDEYWEKNVQSENISTPIYVECYKMYRSKFAFKNSGISCLALIFNLESQKCGSASDESSTIFLREIDTNAWLSG